jgi:hypothetical protein
MPGLCRAQPRTAGFADRFHRRHDAGGGAPALRKYLRAYAEREIHLLSCTRDILYLATRFSIVDQMNVIHGCLFFAGAFTELERKLVAAVKGKRQ